MSWQRFSSPGPGMVGARNYIILVDAPHCKVKLVVESPPEGTLDDSVLYGALEKKWHELASKYPWPKFDIISGRGHLEQIRESLPACSGWETVRLQHLL